MIGDGATAGFNTTSYAMGSSATASPNSAHSVD